MSLGHSCAQDTRTLPSRIPVRSGEITVRPHAQSRIIQPQMSTPQDAAEQSERAVGPPSATESCSLPSGYKQQQQVGA